MSNSTSPTGYLIDMDGVLYRGNAPVPHAREFIARLQEGNIPFLLLTNHSCYTPLQLQRKLTGLGMAIGLENFYTSAIATAHWLCDQSARRVYAIGDEGLHDALKSYGIEHCESNISHVVVGFSRQLDYDQFKLAMRLVKAGAQFVGTNPDPTYPVEDGEAPECGLLLGALQGVTGQAPLIVGKPEAIIYHQAASRLGLPLENLTMIGDRLDTDIIGALGVGAQTVLVLTGHTTREILAESAVVPHRVLENLSELEV
jgi:NagD protein